MRLPRFGQWLHSKMDRRDLNVTGLASILGVSHASVSNWMRGVTEPRRANIEALARAFDVPITDVYAALGRVPPDEDLPEDIRQIVEMLKTYSEAEQRRWAAAIRAYREQTESEQCESEQSE